MKQEIKTQWLADLRSGEFSQCKYRLSDGTGYCCLGVLSERAAQAGIVTKVYINPGYAHYDDDDGDEVLSPKVMVWAEIEEDNPHVPISDSGRLAAFKNEDYSTISLGELNDYGFTFAEIADLIETHL